MTERLRLLPLLQRFGDNARRAGGRILEGQICRSAVVPKNDVLGRLGQQRQVPSEAGREGAGRSLVKADAYTMGCGGETLVDLPVGETGEGQPFQKAQPARVCAQDDMAYLFPKFV